MSEHQEAAHGEGFDYLSGSAHLKHARLNQWMRETLNVAVNELWESGGTAPRVLEVGAGHGTFTETLVAAGAIVTVTEMSWPSSQALEKKFRNNVGVTVTHDPEGTFGGLGEFDLVVYMSVLHHIPDYCESLRNAAAILKPSGMIISFQDPMYYPRQSYLARCESLLAYFVWRVSQGDVVRGLRTAIRRIRGVYDEENVSDMSEYHVVRQGVDEELVISELSSCSMMVELVTYWSALANWAYVLGRDRARPNTFSVVARTSGVATV